MHDNQITAAIDSAKDNYGVITPAALHDQLGSLTPADWKQASMIYTKGTAMGDGLYIEDDANGKVTIHNDMTKAHETGDKPVVKAVWDDAKTAAKVVAGVAFASGLAGYTAMYMDTFEPGALLAAPAISAGLAGLSTGLLVGGEVAGVVATGVLAYDAVRDYNRKSGAQQDLRDNSVVTLNTKDHH
jgi:hypothetical protein